VMKEHNGSVEAANAPGGGAVFTVRLRAAAKREYAQGGG
jgi:signal transduction histidine kinase